MAITLDHFEVTVTLADTGANTSTLTFQCRATDYTTAEADMREMQPLLSAVTDLGIQRISVNAIFNNTAFDYPDDAETAEKASLTVSVDGHTGKKANIKIPGPWAGMFGAVGTEGYNTINTANEEVLAYVNMFKSGELFYISDGEDVGALIGGKRVHARTYKG